MRKLKIPVVGSHASVPGLVAAATLEPKASFRRGGCGEATAVTLRAVRPPGLGGGFPRLSHP